MAIIKLDIVTDLSPINQSIAAIQGVGATAKKTYQDQKQGLKEVADSAATMNKVIADTAPTVNIKNQTSEIGKLKQQIKDYTNEAIRAGSGTSGFAEAIQKAADKKEELGKLQRQIALLRPEDRAQAFTNLGQTIIGVFEGGQGALALFGAKSKDVEEDIKKLQGVIALSEGVSKILQSANSFSVLATEIRNSEIAAKAFNLVMNANPLAIVATVGLALVAVFESLDRSVEIDTSEFIKNNEVIKEAVKARDELRASLAGVGIDLEKEKGILNDSQASVLKLIADQNNKKLDLGKKFGEEAKKIDEQFAEQLRKAKIDDDNKEINAIIDAKDKEKTAIRKALQDQFNVIKEETEGKIQAVQAKANADEIKENDKKNQKIADDNKKALEEKLKAQRESENLAIDQLNKTLEEQKKLKDKEADLDFQLFEEGLKKQVEANKKTADEQKKLADERIKKTIEENQKKLVIAQDFGKELGDLLASHAIDNQKGVEEATKKILLLVVDTLEKTVLANVIASTAVADATSLAQPDSVATFGLTGIARAAILTGLITAGFETFKALITSIGFADGGFTGEGGKYDIAGPVHKGEFVHTQEKTKQHRRLFEAIHSDDYSGLKLIDLKPILEGTGVGLNSDLPKEIYERGVANSSYQEKKKNDELNELRAIKKELQQFKKSYQQKPQETRLPDGTIEIKTGNSTRRIRKK